MIALKHFFVVDCGYVLDGTQCTFRVAKDPESLERISPLDRAREIALEQRPPSQSATDWWVEISKRTYRKQAGGLVFMGESAVEAEQPRLSESRQIAGDHLEHCRRSLDESKPWVREDQLCND